MRIFLRQIDFILSYIQYIVWRGNCTHRVYIFLCVLSPCVSLFLSGGVCCNDYFFAGLASGFLGRQV